MEIRAAMPGLCAPVPITKGSVCFEHNGYRIVLSSLFQPADLAVLGPDGNLMTDAFSPTAAGIADAVEYIDKLTGSKRL